MFLDHRRMMMFENILEKALEEKSLPKFKFEDDTFIIKKLTKKQWNEYKTTKKKEWMKKYNSLSLEDFETVEPSSTYLFVEIAYDTPHQQIREYFYEHGLDIWEEFKYVYER